jgi:hypothetical protein
MTDRSRRRLTTAGPVTLTDPARDLWAGSATHAADMTRARRRRRRSEPISLRSAALPPRSSTSHHMTAARGQQARV